MPLSLAATLVSVPENVITRTVGDSTVLLDVDSGRSFTLDRVGSRVWALLSSLGSAQAAFDALAAEFEVDPRELQQDLEALIAELAESRLLLVQAPPQSS